jgi:hypothetical protein
MIDGIKVFGEELCCFVQLSSGHWAGDDWQNVHVSVDAWPMGETPQRFKHTEFVLASADQAAEYNDLNQLRADATNLEFN